MRISDRPPEIIVYVYDGKGTRATKTNQLRLVDTFCRADERGGPARERLTRAEALADAKARWSVAVFTRQD